MDEPLSALDRATKNEILPFLERLRDHLNLPVVYITHDIAEVERLADQMVLMEKGHVIGSGPLEELQSDPSLPLAAARDAAVSLEGIVQSSDEAYGLLAIKVRGGVLTTPAPAAPVGERRRIRVIASDVSLTREAPGPSSILNVLPARIVSMKPLDTNEVVVVVALGEDGSGARLLSRMMRKSWGDLELAEGMSVYAQVKAVALAPGRGRIGLTGLGSPSQSAHAYSSQNAGRYSQRERLPPKTESPRLFAQVALIRRGGRAVAGLGPHHGSKHWKRATRTCQQ